MSEYTEKLHIRRLNVDIQDYSDEQCVELTRRMREWEYPELTRHSATRGHVYLGGSGGGVCYDVCYTGTILGMIYMFVIGVIVCFLCIYPISKLDWSTVSLLKNLISVVFILLRCFCLWLIWDFCLSLACYCYDSHERTKFYQLRNSLPDGLNGGELADYVERMSKLIYVHPLDMYEDIYSKCSDIKGLYRGYYIEQELEFIDDESGDRFYSYVACDKDGNVILKTPRFKRCLDSPKSEYKEMHANEKLIFDLVDEYIKESTTV